MCASKRSLQGIITLGLILLAIANVATYILTRHTGLSEHVVDPVVGFMQGAAIAVLLVGIYKNRPRLRT